MKLKTELTKKTKCRTCSYYELPEKGEYVCDYCKYHALIIWCSICDSWCWRDNPCRHIFRHSGGYWAGSGTAHHKVRGSFWALLFCVPTLVDVLKEALATGGYNFDRFEDFTGRAEIVLSRGDRVLFEWHEADHDLDDVIDMEDAWNWLLTLEAGKTGDAEALTLKWIDQWLFF